MGNTIKIVLQLVKSLTKHHCLIVYHNSRLQWCSWNRLATYSTHWLNSALCICTSCVSGGQCLRYSPLVIIIIGTMLAHSNHVYVLHKAPIHWFLVSHQVLHLHTTRAGRYYHYVFIKYSHKRTREIWSQEDQHSLYAIAEGLFWMLCSRQTRLFALRSLLRSSVCTPLVCKN